MVKQITKAYIVQEYINSESPSYESHINNIKEINPDSIVVFSTSEYDVEHIFREFISGIESWLEANNKTVTILSPGFDRKISEHVVVNKNFAYYLQNQSNTLFKFEDVDFTQNVNQADKLFTLYCHRSSGERINMIDTLAREHLLSDGIVTYHNAYRNGLPDWKYHDGSPLVDEDTFILSSQLERTPSYFPNSFFRGLVDIVCESRVNPKEYYPSEKTMKSVIAMKPFMVLSCQYFHKYLLEDYGIEPYTELFDYSYDNDPDINNRIEAIAENIKRIKGIDKHILYDRVKDKLAYNRQKFIDYGNNKEKMIPKALEFLLDEHEVYGDVSSNFFEITKHMRNKGWLK
jgi:hypothetical protein